MEIQRDIHIGLALFPDERIHFPRDSIYPYCGVGISPESKTFEIELYQLGLDICPHLKFVNRLAICNIYENRPFACKCFPLRNMSISESKRLNYELDKNCKFIQKLSKEKWDEEIHFEKSIEEEFGYQLVNRIRSALGFHMWMWLFDLKSMKWRSPHREGI